MPLLIDRIKVLRPKLTPLQVEVLCKQLPKDATNEDIIASVLPADAMKLGVGASLADYLTRYRLDDHLTVRQYFDLVVEVDRMLHAGESVDIIRTHINRTAGIVQ